MTREAIREVVLQALSSVAPEIDTATLSGSARLRDEYELDSMDLLNFVVALHERLGVNVPETDYPKLTTLDGAVDYLTARLPPA